MGKKKINALAPANQGSDPSHLCHCSSKPDSTESQAVFPSVWPSGTNSPAGLLSDAHRMCKWISFVHTKQVIVLTNQDLHMPPKTDALVNVTSTGEGGKWKSRAPWLYKKTSQSVAQMPCPLKKLRARRGACKSQQATNLPCPRFKQRLPRRWGILAEALQLRSSSGPQFALCEDVPASGRGTQLTWSERWHFAHVQMLVLSPKSSDELVLCNTGLKFVRGSNHLIKEWVTLQRHKGSQIKVRQAKCVLAFPSVSEPPSSVWIIIYTEVALSGFSHESAHRTDRC